MSDTITIKKPFDSHLHLRRGAMLRAVTPKSAEKFGSAIIMPNTDPPIETVEQATDYKTEILAAVPTGTKFEPLMTFYLTKKLKPAEIEKGFSDASGTKIFAVKSYPYGATTNSQWGYRSILEAKDVLREMERVGMPLLVHGEVHVDEHGTEIDPYEGERRFIEDILPELLNTYPALKVSLEHMSTARAADFIEKNGENGRLVATVTVHHLLYSREDAESEPLLRCKPLIKSAKDRDAVRSLACRGLPFISAGTDSAPHPEEKKRGPNPAFGVFSASVAVELYTQVFDEMNALEKLEGFLSLNGPRFFGLEPSEETLSLKKNDWRAEPVEIEDGKRVISMSSNETIRWQIAQ